MLGVAVHQSTGITLQVVEAVRLDDLPENVRAALEREARSARRSTAEYVLDVIRRNVAVPSEREWLARLSTRRPVLRGDVLAARDEARRERDEELAAADRH